jgi:alpha-D-xyloside xylohydrolase
VRFDDSPNHSFTTTDILFWWVSVWSFGNESEAAIVSVMRIREQMRPYVLDQYKAAAADGTPIMRPLFFDFHDDPQAQAIDDQLMFGPDYMLAPVLNKGVTERSVYLPPLRDGSVWTNYFTHVVHNTSAGGVHIVEQAPIAGADSVFPLYVRTPGGAA